MIAGSFDVNVFANQHVGGPVNCRIEGFEPGMSQDDSVTPNIGDEEAQSGGLGSFLYPEIGILSYGACAVF
jgi:hypothetical protein